MTDAAVRKPSTRWLVLWIGLIVLGAIVACGLAVKWREIEAQYWVWKANGTTESIGERRVGRAAQRRGFMLAARRLPGVDVDGDVIRVPVAYECLPRGIDDYLVLTSENGGCSWTKESVSPREFPYHVKFRDDWKLKKERRGFVLCVKEKDGWQEVHRFKDYPSFRIVDERVR